MKNRTLRMTALVLCLLLCFALAGCGADVSTMLLLRKTGKTLSELEDLSLSFRAEGRALLSGQETALALSGDGVFGRTPLAASAEAEARLGGLVQAGAPILLREEEGSVNLYVGLALSEQTTWLRAASWQLPETELSLSTLATLLGASGSVERVKDAENTGEMHLRVTISGKLLSLAGRTAEDFTAEVWLDRENGMPKRIQAELAPLLCSLLDENTLQHLTPLTLPTEITLTGLNTGAVPAAPASGDVIVDISEIELPVHQ